jgi:hypothetical protein
MAPPHTAVAQNMGCEVGENKQMPLMGARLKTAANPRHFRICT